MLAAVVIIFTLAGNDPAERANRGGAQPTAPRRLPPFWIVHPGDTYAAISAKTGLTVRQVEGLNPNVDPRALVPGERLDLWRHPPPPPPRPVGPRFWTVAPGDSFGSIATKTGIILDRLEQLNPHVKPTALQPGNRVRLRK